MAPIIHIVHFGYKPETSQATKAEVYDRFIALAEQCVLPPSSGDAAEAKDSDQYGAAGGSSKQTRYIESIVGGVNNSPEGFSNGLEHTYVVTFKNQTDRAYYLDTDPAHQDFKKLVLEHVSKLTVMDFEVGKGV